MARTMLACGRWVAQSVALPGSSLVGGGPEVKRQALIPVEAIALTTAPAGRLTAGRPVAERASIVSRHFTLIGVFAAAPELHR